MNAWKKERDLLTEYVFGLVVGKKEDGQVPLGVAIRELFAWGQKLSAKSPFERAVKKEIALLFEHIRAGLYLQIREELRNRGAKAKTADEEAYLLNLRLVFDPEMDRKVEISDEYNKMVGETRKTIEKFSKEMKKLEKKKKLRKEIENLEKKTSVEIEQDRKLLQEMDDGTSAYKRLKNVVEAREEELKGKKGQ